MKGYLLDENLPYRLRFRPSGSVFHSKDIGPYVSDDALWEFARANDLVIVSKDADFSQRILLADPPPKVVHLRFGNLRRENFHSSLAAIWPRVEALLESSKLVNVHLHRLEAVS